MTNLFRTTNAKFWHKWVRFVQDSSIKNNFGVFLCIIVYRLFVLNFWWCILRNIVNISRQVNSALFFNSCYFRNVGFFPLVVGLCPAVPPELGWHNANFGGHAKKKFAGAKLLKLGAQTPARSSGVCAPQVPNFKAVSAPMPASANLSRPTTAVNYSVRYVWEWFHIYIMQITDNANISKSLGDIGLLHGIAQDYFNSRKILSASECPR